MKDKWRETEIVFEKCSAPKSAITLGVFVQTLSTVYCSGGTPQKVSNNILLDPTRKTIFRSTGEIGVRKVFTEGSLERYATLSVKRSHFFVVRRQTKEN